ncbi:MAG: aromatic acid exporter family protein [Lachnospiraceae bacterium]|nr:aromatic acid exporter family protein [Lachnospiraceae bacterium]
MDQMKWRKLLFQAVKIAVGSSSAICLAEAMHLQFAASAGSIALLTIVATKWETFRLSFFRVLTFGIAVLLSWCTLSVFDSDWVAYGVFVFLLLIFCEYFGWKSTVSVNAVIGSHFLSTLDFSPEFILNEFLLVLIGISIAILLNLFHNNSGSRKQIVQNMRYTESRLQAVLTEMAAYLSGSRLQRNVWEDLDSLEKRLQGFLAEAYEYQGNTLQSHTGYYVDYFEMRMSQCDVLYNLHDELSRIRNVPKQAKLVADYMLYMADFVVELNVPQEQIRRLEEIFEAMRREPLPDTREEFENRAMLYHILMDLEEFLAFKKRFVEEMDEDRRKRYWD